MSKPRAPFSQTGRSVVVTGGGTGIGRAVAGAFVRAGAKVMICGRRTEPLEKTCATLGEAARWVRADVTVENDLVALGRAAVDAFGRLDVWVNNAGVSERGVLPEADAEHLQRLLDINVRGVFLGCRVAIPLLRESGGGSIVNVSSYLASHAGASGTLPAYAASKGAVSALTRSLAVYHGPEGIRVNAICPALVPTELNEEFWAHVEDREGFFKQLGERYPMRRVGRPEDVAGAAVFLASDEASWITGQELNVDGGITAV